MFIKIKNLFLNYWWKIKMAEKFPGTDISVDEEIISAYILMKSGSPAYIVIVTSNGSKIYAHTLGLEKALKSKIGDLEEHAIDVHEAIKFYFENQSVIAFINQLTSQKNRFKPG